MTIDPDKLTQLAWRLLLAVVCLWLSSCAAALWLGYSQGYSAGMQDAARLEWG